MKVDAYQPVEEADLRKGFSTLEHLQTIKLLIEKQLNTTLTYNWLLLTIKTPLIPSRFGLYNEH